ncbi:MAG TPA: TfoX/Sxy family protein [Candidatus Ozemobacteraceae bacterium]|nr:TfoX/Sxy family protein [Candidatus Ozemobacteraceae bacterium]
MASDQSYVDYVLEQLEGLEGVSYKKMFGEYGIYCEGKLVVMVCDNQLFVKPTAAGREYIGAVTEASPYPGAKPCFLIDGAADDREWLCRLIRLTTDGLPTPTPRRRTG